MNTYIRDLSQLNIKEISLVGGKNASLGEMLSNLVPLGIKVPDGFCITAEGYRLFITENQLQQDINELLSQLERPSYRNLTEIGWKIRQRMEAAGLPASLQHEILDHYRQFNRCNNLSLAVRSSATAEDLPNASFAGQHESYLNVQGEAAVVEAVKKCFISLYTDRAIKYREDNGFQHEKVFMSVAVQKMVRSDKACAGIGFTLEPESGFRDVVHLTGVWGLGELIVQGMVTPDEFLLFKPALLNNKKALLQKKAGEKKSMMVYNEPGEAEPVVTVKTPDDKVRQLVLNDEELMVLGQWALLIEDHYGKPMDFEWAKDGITGELFIVQARPETVHSRNTGNSFTEYKLQERGVMLTKGEAIGSKIATGIARVLGSPAERDKLQPGEMLVTEITSPDWDPILKKAGGIITNKGGRTSHASIIAREIGVPAIVGCENATEAIKDGDLITLSCAEGKTGFVYEGKLPYSEIIIDVEETLRPGRTKAMLIAADPEKAFRLSLYPSAGIGLMRLEFIITHAVQVHPMALVRFDSLQDARAKQQIEQLTEGYADKRQYFVDKLSQGIAMLAAAFYPREVIVRMSDFKSNEYANLLGGAEFELKEENPMLGFRGASRYYNKRYKEGFLLECAAVKVVREDMGLTNVKVMIPFCRTVDEGKKVLSVMKEAGLERGVNGLEVYMMTEIPSNVLQAQDFAQLFDGFSIGSNDLTQLTLGIDRDAEIISDLFSEQDPSAKLMIGMAIEKARKANVPIGLCGQAPSDFPAFARFLVEKGITSISFNADALMKGIQNICEAEKQLPAVKDDLITVSDPTWFEEW